jgi:hypothetical protein
MCVVRLRQLGRINLECKRRNKLEFVQLAFEMSRRNQATIICETTITLNSLLLPPLPHNPGLCGAAIEASTSFVTSLPPLEFTHTL